MKITELLANKSNNLQGEKIPTIAFLGDSVTQGCFELYTKSDGNMETYFDKKSAYYYRNYSGTVTNVYTIDHDLFANDASYSSIVSSYEYSNVCENSGYRHSNLWHKEYMILWVIPGNYFQIHTE